jgi:hypothetical protein
LHEFLVSTRNQKVSSLLQNNYRDRIADNAPHVFCISNQDYWNHRNSSGTFAKGYLQLSGVIGLRRYCISLVADSQLKAAVIYMKREIPAVLGSIDLWVQSGTGEISAERRRAIRASVDQVERSLRNHFTAPGADLKKFGRTLELLFKKDISRTHG